MVFWKGKRGADSDPPTGWTRCGGCGEIVDGAQLARQANVCPRCSHHEPISTPQWIELLTDPESFVSLEEPAAGPREPSGGFRGLNRRRRRARRASGSDESTRVGNATLEGHGMVLALTTAAFLGGSLGFAAAERLLQGMTLAGRLRRPFVFCVSSIGLRLDEGIELMAPLERLFVARRQLAENRVPFISLLTHSVSGGAASIAFAADLVVAEPTAKIGGREASGTAVDVCLPRHTISGWLGNTLGVLLRDGR